jgi:hypothetical protein
MKTDPEAQISADGIFISCSLGPVRLWEFHPDDVTSVGVYRDDGRMHEVIVTLNRDFDLSEGMNGLKDLNDRLSRELRAPIGIDAVRGASPSGVILWPPHLVESPLWEFYLVGKDGLWIYVSPDHADAERTIYGPVHREMARYANPHLPTGFPQMLIDRGFAYHGEIGWYTDDALLAAEWLRGRGAAIIRAELWLVKKAVVQPHIQTASGIIAYRYSTTTRPSETWEAFANHSLNEVAAFLRQFKWPENSREPVEGSPRFCLGWVWKEWVEE